MERIAIIDLGSNTARLLIMEISATGHFHVVDQLKEARARIEQIDQKMADLFCERMQAAELVAEHKKIHGLPVYDEDREAALVKRNVGLVENPVYREYYVNFLKDVMKISRQYQHRLLQGMKLSVDVLI